ncbi:hypothetical protein DVH05_028647 [Phytophthora capsici]|nr:hypothetical protein DVH05_028647 [Phytophthora capsici]
MERGDAEDYALGTEEKESDREELYTRAEAAPDRSSGIAAVLSDVNILQTEENLDEFTALVSDAENDDGASDGESSEAESNAYEDIALEESDSNEEAADALFDEMLLESAGGIAGIAGGNINADILKDMGTSGWTEPVSYSPYPYLDEPFEARDSGAMANEFPGLYGGDYGPTTRALEAASTAIDIFFYFVQPQLWEDIAAASNEYFMEQLDERVEGQYKKQEARERKQPDYNKSSREEIKASLLNTPDVTARELCVFIGLLVARTISPNKEKLQHHWKSTDEGAIPRGRFGIYMPRDRFMHISRNLHFSSNSDPRATSDRAWKLRPVIDSLQERFKLGYNPPPVMVFDEAMLPSRSSFNRMRVYMKDKPHKWGTKLFMLCCSSTAYCIRFEVYCGKKQTGVNVASTDTKSGPAAVIRNLIEVFGSDGSDEKRLVVTDRFYTSPSLAMQLLALGFYSIGTIMTNRKGFCKAIVEKKKQRPATVPRGLYTVTESTVVPCMKAVCWWDNRPVHLLSAGGSIQQDRVVRREKSGEQAEVACPRILKDYQTFMGGVDVHDQLRLQRYSLQLSLKYKKYYKGLFLGFIDLAIVNSLIVYNQRRVAEGKRKVSHIKFLKQLHLELVQLHEDDWDGIRCTQQTPTKPRKRGRPAQHLHELLQVDEWRDGNNGQGRKRRQRTCKVCSKMKRANGAKGGEASYYCKSCRLPTPSKTATASRVYLCNKIKHKVDGKELSCFDIWHTKWRNGTNLPPSIAKKRIRARTPGAASTTETRSASDETTADDEPDKRQRVETTV